jgi:predicted permease
MTDSLFQAYSPLLLWTGVGIILFRFLPDAFPRWLGRGLYWVGIPLEILALTRQTDFSAQAGIAPLVTIAAVSGGLLLALVSLQMVRWLSSSQGKLADKLADQPIDQSIDQSADKPPDNVQPDPGGSLAVETKAVLIGAASDPDPWQSRSRQGSFILSSIIGNTGFVGLAVVPVFISPAYLSWLVFYSVTQNVVGTYGIGVLLASYFGRHAATERGWTQLRDILTVPSLWAFVIGFLTHRADLPSVLEEGLSASIWIIIPAALMLMGMRLSQIQGWKSLRFAVVPAVLKVLVIPALVGLATLILGVPAEPRLALVLMAGMPTAFAGLILAEEYDLDRDLIASSIVLTTTMLLITLPLWLRIFGKNLPETLS